MTEPYSTTILSVGDQQISLRDFLRHLHERRMLIPSMQEVAIDMLISQEAAIAGLAVTDEELQSAADAYRRKQGLLSAQSTHEWLNRQQLAVEGLERSLERELLRMKMKNHVAGDRIAEYFGSHRSEFDSVCLRQIIVAREDLARELRMQIEQEGADFTELAKRHSIASGDTSIVLQRRQLPPATADQIFNASAGTLLGPLAMATGFHLCLIQEQTPAALDATTAAAIRERLFAAWLRERLQSNPVKLSLLEML